MHVSAPYAGRLSTSAPQEKGLLASPHTPRTYLPHPARGACLPAPQTPRACLPAPHTRRAYLPHPARGACLPASCERRLLPAPHTRGVCKRTVRGVLASAPYARCWQAPHTRRAYLPHPARGACLPASCERRLLPAPHTRGVCKRTVRGVLASAPYARCWQAPHTRGASSAPYAGHTRHTPAFPEQTPKTRREAPSC